MELKLQYPVQLIAALSGLNRTFYGIEIRHGRRDETFFSRLNRTFYGIEISFPGSRITPPRGLNRTFYGIEILESG